MKIEIGKSYHIPTEEARNDFLKQADKQGLKWMTGTKASDWNAPFGKKFYIIRYGGLVYGTIGLSSNDEYAPFIPWKIETSTPKVLRLNGLKIVINAPHVIVTDGTFTGKAKCNPADTFDAAIGLELAVERYKGEKEKGKTISFRKFGPLDSNLHQAIETTRLKIGDKVRIKGAFYHNHKDGSIGAVIGIAKTGSLVVRVDGYEQNVAAKDLELIDTDFKVGDRVEMIKTGGYTFDEIGNMGRITNVTESYIEVKIDGVANNCLFGDWSYLNSRRCWKKLCTK